MKIKRYIVREMQEAIRLIKQDLGPEAVIVSSYKVPAKGLIGFFTPRLLEVTAALDESPDIKLSVDCIPARPAIAGDAAEVRIVPAENAPRALPAELPAGRPPVRSSFKIENAQKNNHPASSQIRAGRESERPAGLFQEPFPDLSDSLHGPEPKTVFESIMSRQVEAGLKADPFLRWRKILIDMEVQENIADYLLRLVKNDGRHENVYFSLLKQVINLLEPAYRPKGLSRVLAFVGPSGMGKTTTLLKLATKFSLYEHKKVALVAVYTYRIGAVEQLRAYGDFLGIPVEVVMTPAELGRAIESHADKDYVFIDTAGRSARNTGQILELKEFFDEIKEPKDVFLVLSSVAKNKELSRIAQVYRKIYYSKLIFTNIDETETHGSIINLVCATGMPVAYLADGQGIPDDVSEAGPKKIAKLLFRGVDPYEVMAI